MLLVWVRSRLPPACWPLGPCCLHAAMKTPMCRRRLPKSMSPLPLKQDVTPYLYATGNTAAVNTTTLVARV